MLQKSCHRISCAKLCFNSRLILPPTNMFEAQIVQKLENNEALPKFTGSFNKTCTEAEEKRRTFILDTAQNYGEKMFLC